MVVAPKDVKAVVGILEDHGENPALIGEVTNQIGSQRVSLYDEGYPKE
jgi:hydrogenase maturation factor